MKGRTEQGEKGFTGRRRSHRLRLRLLCLQSEKEARRGGVFVLEKQGVGFAAVPVVSRGSGQHDEVHVEFARVPLFEIRGPIDEVVDLRTDCRRE